MCRRALLLVPLLGLLLTACGDAATPPVEWAGRVCAALTPWRTQIADLNTQAQRQMAAAKTPTQTRDNLTALLSGGESASETARAAVVAAGAPDVDGGDEVARRFVATLVGVRDAYAHARTDLAGLAMTDEAAFYDGVATVVTTLNQEYARSALDTSTFDSPELKQAFIKADSCR